MNTPATLVLFAIGFSLGIGGALRVLDVDVTTQNVGLVFVETLPTVLFAGIGTTVTLTILIRAKRRVC